ncbi:hypothetical protein [Nocardia paucivorans]|uniref:hypothetical protein n=1 Tax=Nocardia paucivorans TaxID=114259 RepID=UPI0002D8FC23|nr:hypothetical protein [Nocardia paucivorans]
MAQKLSDIFPGGHTVDEVSDAIVRTADLPDGECPFRVTIDPTNDGSEVVSAVYDHIRHDFYHRIGIQELLSSGSGRRTGLVLRTR